MAEKRGVVSPAGVFGKALSPDPNRSYFADNLRRLIGMHCASGAVVAEAIGVSRQTISDLIATKRQHPPSLNTLYRAAQVFGVDPDKLYREPFWSWAADYCRAMAEPVDDTGMIEADGVGDALFDAAERIQEREHPERYGRSRKTKGKAK
jgi:transcriptional regulator with XRE-family HTH domain